MGPAETEDGMTDETGTGATVEEVPDHIALGAVIEELRGEGGCRPINASRVSMLCDSAADITRLGAILEAKGWHKVSPSIYDDQGGTLLRGVVYGAPGDSVFSVDLYQQVSY